MCYSSNGKLIHPTVTYMLPRCLYFAIKIIFKCIYSSPPAQPLPWNCLPSSLNLCAGATASRFLWLLGQKVKSLAWPLWICVSWSLPPFPGLSCTQTHTGHLSILGPLIPYPPQDSCTTSPLAWDACWFQIIAKRHVLILFFMIPQNRVCPAHTVASSH